MAPRAPPQAFLSSYAPRLRAYNNSLLVPVIHSSAPSGPISRTTKRGTTVINYAEDGYDYEDDDSEDNRRRPTGLRSLRREDSAAKLEAIDKVGKDATEPVEVQGIWRDWMNKAKSSKNEMQNYAQSNLPLTLIPIRVDVEIPPFIPPPAYPAPTGPYDPSLPQYRPGEQTVPYRLKDTFLWNLHETLITTDQFAVTLVQDLDLPNRTHIVSEISKQIRTQLEEYAGVALHPLFHAQQQQNSGADATRPALLTTSRDTPSTPLPAAMISRADTPSRTGASAAATMTTPSRPQQPAGHQQAPTNVSATATPITPESDDFNPDDTYRCIVTLNINLGSAVYTDKFEWSLLHPPGFAEVFAKQTCADLGLTGEWVPTMTTAIYEAVLRLKKEACESGGLVSGWASSAFGGGLGGGGELPNDAANAVAGAGWRYNPDDLGESWEPKVEFLSREEIEKREGDRERESRRLRRETARFSSNTGMVGGVPMGFGFGGLIEQEEERMGRSSRSRAKRRFRSLSPLGRSGTPGGRGTPDAGGASGGYGGGGAALTDHERFNWRCSHCMVWGTSVWAVRDGPRGPRSLCNNCGFLYERDRKLSRFMKNLHYADPRPF